MACSWRDDRAGNVWQRSARSRVQKQSWEARDQTISLVCAAIYSLFLCLVTYLALFKPSNHIESQQSWAAQEAPDLWS